MYTHIHKLTHTLKNTRVCYVCVFVNAHLFLRLNDLNNRSITICQIQSFWLRVASRAKFQLLNFSIKKISVKAPSWEVGGFCPLCFGACKNFKFVRQVGEIGSKVTFGYFFSGNRNVSAGQIFYKLLVRDRWYRPLVNNRITVFVCYSFILKRLDGFG